MDISKLPKVIDVSRWQGHINWGTVRGNVSAAIVKIGGSDDGFYTDGQAQRNLIEARAAGVPIGTYVYLGGVFSPEEEAQHIINLFNQLGGLRSGEPFVLDWEERRAGLDEVGYLRAIVERLSRAGFPTPIIYMNLNYVRTQDWTPLVKQNCGLWVAAWGNNDAVPTANEVPGSDEWPFWILWQYSSTGSVPGISGRVDQNVLSGTVDTFKQYGLKSTLNLPGTPPPVPQPVPPSNAGEYTVVANDTLSGIAGKYKRSWQELYAMNRDRVSNPNRIYTGQKLRVWASANPPAPTKPIPSQPVPRVHVVENGENLSVIAARYKLSSWRTIYDMNKQTIGDNPNVIKPGQRLRIP
jgi:GH25 family lysozyme M1 (1,4-beta-N-acetylmuramidase)